MWRPTGPRGCGPLPEGADSRRVRIPELNRDWNLITRTILPFIWQPEFYPGQGSRFGLGDNSDRPRFVPFVNIKGKATVIIGKQRNGPTGDVTLTFLREFTKFVPYSPMMVGETEPDFSAMVDLLPVRGSAPRVSR